MEIVSDFGAEELQLDASVMDEFAAQNLPWGKGSALPVPCAVHCAIHLMTDFLKFISTFFAVYFSSPYLSTLIFLLFWWFVTIVGLIPK